MQRIAKRIIRQASNNPQLFLNNRILLTSSSSSSFQPHLLSLTFMREGVEPAMKKVKFHHVSSTNSLPQYEEEGYDKYNMWRVDSINNPIWKQLSNSNSNSNSNNSDDHDVITMNNNNNNNKKKKNQLASNRFSFHSSLLHAQKDTQDIYSLHITEQEQKIFDFLLTVNETYDMKTVLRVAGGWVRNKLLNMDGEDIDIALDNCMGVQFAEKVLDYEKAHDMPDQYHSIGVISANPEQSKHLETATTHILGESIDFVNLRCEEYAEDCDHRIPQSIRVGTAEEDAYRRDLTINSMFYNINEAKVEDFTGRGIDDLKRGIVRTPLPPLKTFLDDPLRVLRAVRFAASFNFVVADELIEASKNNQVAKALAEKVSRERVGIEVGKMLRGKDPVGAFALLKEMEVAHIVFNLSTHIPKTAKQTRIYEDPIAIDWTPEQWDNALFRMRFVFLQAQKLSLPTEQRAQLVFAAFLSNVVPRNYLPASDVSIGDHLMLGDGLTSWCDNLLCTSLKLPSKFSSDIAHIIFGAHVLSHLLLHEEIETTHWSESYEKHVDRKHLQVGRWLRVVKELYPLACLLASVYDTVGIEFSEHRKVFLNGSDDLHHGQLMQQAIESVFDGRFAEAIHMKPVLNGRQVAEIAGVKPGSVLTHINKELLDWQLEHFSQIITQDEEQNKKQASEWLLSQKERFQNLEKELNNSKGAKKQQQQKK